MEGYSGADIGRGAGAGGTPGDTRRSVVRVMGHRYRGLNNNMIRKKKA